MTPRYDIVFEAGETWRKAIKRRIKATGAPVDMTGSIARLAIRESFGDESPLLALEIGNGITLTGSSGLIELVITASQTASLAGKDGVYDLEVQAANGDVTKLIKGAWRCAREVTL